jgi:hypothetical protein
LGVGVGEEAESDCRERDGAGERAHGRSLPRSCGWCWRGCDGGKRAGVVAGTLGMRFA